MAEVSGSNSPPKPDQSKRPRFKSDPNHSVRKRFPPRASKNPSDLYITNKSDFQGQLSKCQKLLEGEESEVVLHGLGAAIPRALNLALLLEANSYGTYCLDVQTSSLKLVDDIEALTDEGETSTQSRVNSAVKIRVFKQAITTEQRAAPN